MGRIRTADIKKVSFELVRSYPDKFSSDFAGNKEALKEFSLTDEKKSQNRIAGYISRIMKRKA